MRGKNIQLGRVGCNYGKLLIFIDIYFVSLRIVSDKSMSRGFLRKSSVNTFIGIVWILFAVSASAQNAVSKFRADSIRQSLSCIQKPQDKIPLLKELIGLYWQLPEEVPALKEIIDIAMPLDSIGIVYDAMAGLSRYYYNVENRDSLLYWVGQLDSLASKRHESPRGLFLSGSLVCQDYLWSGNYELAMDRAMRYMDLARDSKSDYGLLRAYRDLGMVYQRIRRDSDAVVSFQEGLDLLKDIKDVPDIMDTKIRLTSYQLESSVRTKQYTLTERILEQYKALLDEQYEINLSFQLAPDREKVYIAVTDTGAGIPLEKQAAVFNRFEKLDDYKPGAGLGLSICLLIAERLNGSLSIDSSYTDGARFVLILSCEIDSSIYNPPIEV